MWERPTALARAMSAGTSPPSVCAGSQIHMPLPCGIVGGGGRGGGGGSVVVVVAGDVVSGGLTLTFFGAGALGVGRGVTTPAGMGLGAGIRARGGMDGVGAAGAIPPWVAAAAVARMARIRAAAKLATTTRA